MTEIELNELQQRIDTAKKLKDDLRKSKELTELVGQLRSLDYKRPYNINSTIGSTVVKWITSSDADYEAFLEFIKNHEQTALDAFESL